MRIGRNPKRYTPAAIMARSKLFQDYQRAFAAASGLTLVLGEPDSPRLVEWPAESANPFCARLAGTVNACASCREFQAKLAAAATARGSEQTRQCHAGLSETMVPVRYGNRVFALLQIGQVRLRPATDDDMKRAVQDMAAASRSLKQDVLAAELKAARTYDPAHYAGLVRLLEMFSFQLGEWFVRHGVAETPRPATAVMRVKEWLDSHYHEPITLDDAAKAVGFQSISQFNRTFRKANDQSAREYRRASAARPANDREPSAAASQPRRRAVREETLLHQVA